MMTTAPGRGQGSKVKEEEEESTEQRMEMCRSAPQHNRNQQREHTTFD